MKLLTTVFALCLVPFAFGQKWSFVVGGDGRADGNGKRVEDKNGINTLIMGEMAQAVVKEKAKFLVWTGDLVRGASEKAAFESMLMDWRAIMEPVYAAGIKVLPVRGNHETICKDSVEVWDKVFSGKYALPANGPQGEKNRTFFYEQGPVLMIGLDQYSAPVRSVNQIWLDKVLATHKKPFIFSMGHEPAFMDGVHKDTMDADAVKRDAFWKSLAAAGARTFFAGHDHLYDHMVVTRTGPNPGPELHQFVAGTAGAPFYKPGPYTGVNDGWDLKRVKNIPNTYGYLLVEIDGKKVTITFKGRTSPGVYEAMDSFSYSAGK